MAKQATLVWVDGQSESQLNVVRTVAGVGAIETALSNHSQAGVVSCSEGVLELYSPTIGVSQYSTCRVNAVLTFVDGTGSIGRLYLPAPDANIFMSDGSTVDPTMITDIITAAIGSLLAGSGNPVVAYQGGILTTGRIRNNATPN